MKNLNSSRALRLGFKDLVLAIDALNGALDCESGGIKVYIVLVKL